ncbi:pyruvate carboxylase [bacterium]|nr:pyruvate carboxylase [bacterium]
MDIAKKINRLLIANRGEIAIRIARAAIELGMHTISIYSNEDRFALHRFKTDESYLVGEGKGPIEAYLDIADIIRIAKEVQADAIHPGYGFLSENPDFVDACVAAGVTFVGPPSDVMRRLGNKVSARNVAVEAGAPVVPASKPLPADDPAQALKMVAEIGYPVMAKASWGGGGRGMRVVQNEKELLVQVEAARREAKAAFGNDEVYVEKLVLRARHLEVQILGDIHGNIFHLFERDCSLQRRNQKVVERAPAIFLDDAGRKDLCEAALKIARAAHYQNAGTVEFLMDMDTKKFYFMEVNPRVQVEHTVTEVVTGIDIVKAQLMIAQGAELGTEDCRVPKQEDIKLNGHAIQCRVTTEDPENNFIPDYGRITVYRGAMGFGIRLDGGTAYSGALITRHYDSLLEKVTAWGSTPEEARLRINRALREFRILGIATNLNFLENLVCHPTFKNAEYTTRFIDESKDIFKFAKRRDRATRILSYIGNVIINGNDDVAGRPEPLYAHQPIAPRFNQENAPPGLKQLLDEKGPVAVAQWMKDQKRLLITDVTMRDAHQSLLATRMRTYDMLAIAPAYSALLPNLFSVECWGGATFDVAMRFLKECPWERLQGLRVYMPNMLTQMLLRASNGVGYTNYPDNVVKYFVKQAANNGMDLFRVFDSLNWVENMRLAMDAVIENNKICEAAICYTGDITNPNRTKYSLKYYVDMAKQLEKAGAHILAIKDMAGVLKPAAATILIKALKEDVGLPIHLHSHDTSGIAAATLLAAADAGVDAIDAAMDSMSGLTSHPNLGSIVAALKYGPRDTELDQESVRTISDYWEKVRRMYGGFEAEIRCGTSEVYLHEMPGGQYTNLRQQARALGIEDRWPEVAKVYAQVNEMFGDIVKVTPSSKVVGDMALTMITSGITKEEVLDPNREISFPESVVSMFKGMMGQPLGGFPKALQKKILKDEVPITVRPGLKLAPADLSALREEAEKKVERKITDQEFTSYLMYPKVYVDYAKHLKQFGNITVLPTLNFYYGMIQDEELPVHIDYGKTLIIRFLALGQPNEEGNREAFFELNGQPRVVRMADKSLTPDRPPREKADSSKLGEVGAPMRGLVSTVIASVGKEVEVGDVLLTIEAMKMETNVTSEIHGVVERIVAPVGTQVETKDLLVVIAKIKK